MNIVVTGSIAFDYLMSFPGKFTEHFLPGHMDRVSLSFLVDTMDKRRGGCAPNIAYTLALLGARPLLMATRRRGTSASTASGSTRRASTPRSLPQIPGKFCASFFCPAPTSRTTRSRPSTHGAMADAGQLSFRSVKGLRPGDHRRQTIRRRWSSTPTSAGRSASRSSSIRASSCARMEGDQLRDGVHRRDDRHRQRLRAGAACGRRPA